ncbi:MULTISPECIES: hypothetical protein [unclassified Rathayibacter]|uniref:hypothetical protein n=1 Tax=unclassified Rathayibacter TaxID=2609250 RepID=UPI0006F48CBF|nr:MULTISPECIES: hypothetical protein [unclassified Rathayibacter]KQQ00593.1 hypothetical protein ASF42_14660 [Rathayibacter sp. Leaf294]KQS10792.1 hypothetical protein ASG06_14660 [Rathayibacter sp. Leaf185]
MTDPPTAEVIRSTSYYAVIRCPYCGHKHSHPDYRPGWWEHRTAKCLPKAGTTMTDRMTGYRFRVPKKENR